MPKIPIEVEAEQSLEQLRDLSRRIRESSNESSNFLSELKKLRNAYKDLNYSQVQELENYKKLSSSRENYQKKTEALRYEVKKITSQYSEWMDATRSPSKGIEQMISLLDKINVSNKLSDLGKIVKPTGSSGSSFRSPETDSIISKYSGTSFQHMIDANAKKFSSSSIVQSAEELKEDLNNITMDFFNDTFDGVDDKPIVDVFKRIRDEKHLLDIESQIDTIKKNEISRKAEQAEITRAEKMKKGLMEKIRSFKFYLGLTMMFYNLTKKIIGTTQVMSQGWNMIGSAFGFILDMIFLPLLPIIVAIVKAMFGLGARFHEFMKTLHNIHPWLDKIVSLILFLGSTLVIAKIGSVVTAFVGLDTILGAAGVFGKLTALRALLTNPIGWGILLGSLSLMAMDALGWLDAISDAGKTLKKMFKPIYAAILDESNLFGQTITAIWGTVGDVFNLTLGKIMDKTILTPNAMNEILRSGDYSAEMLEHLRILNPDIEYWNPDQYGTKGGYYDMRGSMLPSEENRVTNTSQVANTYWQNITNVPSKNASINLDKTAGLAQ